MSSNERSGPPEGQAGHGRRKPARHKVNTDLRIRRTRERLGAALIALIEEKPIDNVTVREVLDRAGGRALHFLSSLPRQERFAREPDGEWPGNVEQHSLHLS
jgi:hypothetical protein